MRLGLEVRLEDGREGGGGGRVRSGGWEGMEILTLGPLGGMFEVSDSCGSQPIHFQRGSISSVHSSQFGS